MLNLASYLGYVGEGKSDLGMRLHCIYGSLLYMYIHVAKINAVVNSLHVQSRLNVN